MFSSDQAWLLSTASGSAHINSSSTWNAGGLCGAPQSTFRIWQSSPPASFRSCPPLRGAEPRTHLLRVERLRPVIQRHFGLALLAALQQLELPALSILPSRLALHERSFLILGIRVVVGRHLICECVLGGRMGGRVRVRRRLSLLLGDGILCWLGGEHRTQPRNVRARFHVRACVRKLFMGSFS